MDKYRIVKHNDGYRVEMTWLCFWLETEAYFPDLPSARAAIEKWERWERDNGKVVEEKKRKGG